MQMAAFRLFGVSILALTLLKNLLLFLTCALAYLNARHLTQSHLAGVAAAASLFLLPQVAWASQRDLTHSVLAAMFALATLYAFLRLVDTRELRWYAVFGLCVGFGCLAKYNFVFLPVGLLLAALSCPGPRRAVLNPRLLLALALGAIIVLPNGLWMLEHWGLATRTASKFEIQATRGFGASVEGLLHLAGALAVSLGPMAFVHAIVFARTPRNAGLPPGDPEVPRVVLRAFLVVIAAVAVLIIAFGVGGFRERWLLPVLVLAPVVAVSYLRTRVDPPRVRWLLTAGVTAAAAVAIALPGRVVLAERLGLDPPLNRPYDALASAMRGALAPGMVIVAENNLLGGNLRFALGTSLVVTPALAPLLAPSARPVVLAWEATESPAIVPRVWRHAEQAGLRVAANDVRFFLAPYKYHSRKQARLGIVRAE
jgi:4-amino-4-deoxy-L-arabinose transferase-like glycosyltransferase